MNLANRITILRILLIPFFITAILYSRFEYALLIFIVAALSDGVDGYIARATKQRSRLGKILDPIADKLLILSAYICFTVSSGIPAHLKPPTYVPIIIISRDAIIILGALLIHFTKGELEIKPTIISKITTFFQMATVLSILFRYDFSSLLWNIAVGFTICSGIDYVIKGSRSLSDK
ncbi:MAG: CDP-alcohol phosphatidyltransferase family protein [Candidatus Omnitrophota bacterium]